MYKIAGKRWPKGSSIHVKGKKSPTVFICCERCKKEIPRDTYATHLTAAHNVLSQVEIRKSKQSAANRMTVRCEVCGIQLTVRGFENHHH